MKKELESFEEVFIVFKQQENIFAVNPLWYTLDLILGCIFLVFALIFLTHTLLSTQGFYVVLEMILGFTYSLNVFFSIFFFLFITAFLGMALIKGTFKGASMLDFIFSVPPFKINQTWTNTFLFLNNALLLGFIGMIVYFMKYSPTYFRFLAAELIFNQIIIKIGVCNMIYSFQIFEYLFLIFFVVGMFATFFEKSPK